MSKIMIIGCPGSGKSTFAKKLKEIKKYPLYHLDLIWNKPDKTTITREEFDRELDKILALDSFIVDGNYQRTLETRLKACDIVFLLDYPVDVCLSGAVNRVGIQRDDMPWFENDLNEEFKQRIIDFRNDKLPEIYKLLEKYSNDKQIIVFKTREDADLYLEKCKA